MMRLFSGLVFVLLSTVLHSQIFDPVSLTTNTKTLDNGNIRLSVETEIEKGWNIYALILESDAGPIPSSLVLSEIDDFTLIGTAKESTYKTKDDPIFAMQVNYHQGKATFYQDIQINNPALSSVSGTFEYMACDAERCLPPEVFELTWILPKTSASPKDSALSPPNNPEQPTQTVKSVESKAEDSPSTAAFFDPIQWSFSFSKAANGVQRLTALAVLEKGWHLYATDLGGGDGPIPTTFSLADGIEPVSALEEPQPIVKYDPNFQIDLAFHEDSVRFFWDIKVPKDGIIQGAVEFMVCTNERCLAPETIDFSNQEKNDALVALATDIDENLRINGLDLNQPASDCNISTSVSTSKKSHWNIFLLGFIGGLLALLTPCVFPMIPLTVSFFTKGGNDKSGKWQSVLYGVFIVLIYLLLSVPFYFLDSINPEILNNISTNVYLNLFFFVIFVLFAISFFGYFEITMPARFTNKIDSASNVGGIIGIFFMALTLSLVSFSCTGPILGSLLAGSLSADGGAIQLSAGMGGFGLALALPFALFAAFPRVMKKMPQSGSWLNTVKVVLGFVELALAIKFLSNADLVEHWGLLKREVFFGLWIVIGSALVLYLLGKIRFPHDSAGQKIGTGRKLLGLGVFLFVLYLLPGLSNTKYANRQLMSGFPPPLFYSVYERENDCPLGIACFKDFNEGLAAAKAANKPILLDFTGWACVNCRKMEENVWIKPEVYKRLSQDVVLVSLYVDDRKPLHDTAQFVHTNAKGRTKKIKSVGAKWATFQTVNFINNSQPYYVLISPNGKLLTPAVGYTPKAAEYVDFLDCGINAYNELKKGVIQD